MVFRARLVGKFLVDLLLWGLAAPAAFALRLDGFPPIFFPSLVGYTLVSLPIKALAIFAFRYYRQSWRRLSVRDLSLLVQGTALVVLVNMALGFIVFTDIVLPRSVPALDGLLGLVFMGGLRLVARMINETPLPWNLNANYKRSLIVGAGDAGTMVAHQLLTHPHDRIPVGFLDDYPAKQHERYMGLDVLGQIDDLPSVVKSAEVDEILIAMPSVPGRVVRRVVETARASGVASRIIPSVQDIISGRLTITQIREIDLEDLLRREPVNLNLSEIAHYLEDKTILVTGAGGSIGSEIVRQVSQFKPAHVVLLGHGENSLYHLGRELAHSGNAIRYTSVVASLQRGDKLRQVMKNYRPDVVFHAGAHKHVPLMEDNPDEAIYNNVVGTRNLLDAVRSAGVQRFINISSDKAVNPTSVMGASKRVAEYLVEQAAHQVPKGWSYASVRFGNVLGSRGSVVPLFKEQIKAGGPVTVTHPEMTRYFMTIPEAVQLVLQAGGLSENGAVYILDMGDPVKIDTLARDLIRLSGLVPDDDIEIVYTGIRPGEKLYEEPLPREEGVRPSAQEKIYITNRSGAPDNLDQLVKRLVDAADKQDDAVVREALRALIPSYAPYELREPPVETLSEQNQQVESVLQS
jgi:FlaA1/EpsC-like NDP-sugar epimerase